MKTLKTILITIILAGVLLQSCNSSDDSSGSNCPTLIDQPAQGSFRGTSFVSPDAYYRVSTFGQTTMITARIYVREAIDGDCLFPFFGEPEDVILFGLPSLEVQTISLQETGDNTLNFNRIVDGVTEVELAVCGTIEITSYNETTGELQGTITAKGQEGSTVNGNFTLQFCDA